MKHVFEGMEALTKFGEFLERCVGEAEAAEIEAGKVVSEVLYEKAQGIFGDSNKLADLAPSTQEERVRLGYSPNDPLKRDGTLLAKNVERAFGPHVGAIGSSEPAQLAHETGYVSVLTNTSVPPRPVFRLALEESEPAVLAIASSIAGATLGANPASIVKSIL